ncbi:UDP-glucuronosyltransferase 1-6-like isoform X6 [Bufo gargarizans]|uniref:UDP-glucuronosyltransferase 1-6-like isoform X6 n=1 Tax=Bufo gargarizans TaxID=30331 RepID=UPI001CF2A4DD|nr:UDP-glucuronosyltransferase 1-6-like isoform X6 [Bufo gargarizans]
MRVQFYQSLAADIAFFLITFSLAECGRLLVMPQEGSPWLSMQSLVHSLSKRGHQTVVITSETKPINKNLGYAVQTYNVPPGQGSMEDFVKQVSQEAFEHKTIPQKIQLVYKRLTDQSTWLLTSCKNVLQNETLIEYLKKGKFDAMLSDPLFPCGEIIAECLSIPSVVFTRGSPFAIEQEAAQSPSPPSYVPKLFTTFTDHMTFIQRLQNVFVSLFDSVLFDVLYSPYAKLATEFLKRDVSVMDLYRRASIWLLTYDFVFEFPKPVMPNMVFIGGINCANRKLLNQDFEKLVNSSGEHGFVVFSLGSMVSEIPMDKAMDMAEAFRSIPQTVIWRYTGKVPSNLGSNTHLVKWLPQNDLLAHPKARAFITHAGSHGIYEGICNAVPMVMLPLFGDQMDNAKRMESRGAGVTLNVLDMTPEDLINALDSVINKPSYKENVQRLSALHLDRPIHPLDLAVHWVEFVMRHKGAPHLRPAAHDLNWIQYHSLDVFAFLLAVLVTTFFISFKCCAYTCRRCCGRKSRPKSKSKKE